MYYKCVEIENNKYVFIILRNNEYTFPKLPFKCIEIGDTGLTSNSQRFIIIFSNDKNNKNLLGFF